jgi:hypothetical protein
VILFNEVELIIELENIIVLSLSFLIIISKLTPEDGIVELTFTFIGNEASLTASIFPVPGSSLIEKLIEASAAWIDGA